MTHEPTARVVAGGRESLRALTLAEMPRLGLLEKEFDRGEQQRHADNRRRAFVITGEGGMGKSVILGQLLDRFEQPSIVGCRYAGAAVFVSCAMIVLPPGRLTHDEVNVALGRAIGDQVPRFRSGLLEGMQELARDHGSVTLLLDTLDLLLNPDTLPGLSATIANALDIGDVVVTCREDEFSSYLRDAGRSVPRLAGRMTQVQLPRLSGEEIVAWAQHYLTATGDAPGGEESAFLDALQGRISHSGSLREVCSVPVRLALTCEVFGSTGHLPEDLTVTDLYNAYWDARVIRHAGARSAAGEMKEETTLQAAAHILTATGTLALQVPKAALPPSSSAGLRLLCSEGVLLETRLSWEFFHQTFAEYACAAWILRQGPTAAPLAELTAHLHAGKTNLWALARSVLCQAASPEEYADLVHRLPLTGPEGAKSHAVAALRQPGPSALAAVLEQINADPILWSAILPDLASAPRGATTAPDAVLTALLLHPTELAAPATAALEGLITRAGTSTATLLADAVDLLLKQRRQIGGDKTDHYTARLVNRLLPMTSDPAVLDVLVGRYTTVGPLVRQATIRLYLAGDPTPTQVSALATDALANACPPLDHTESVDLLDMLWHNRAVRASRDWRTWRELLTEALPPGGWHNAKVRFTAHLCMTHEDIREQFVDDIATGRMPDSVAYVNTFEHLTAAQPVWVAERLLTGPAPTDRAATGAICGAGEAFAAGLPQATSLRLMHWLTPCRDLLPRGVWPAQIILARGSVTVQQQIYDDLLATNPRQQIIDSAIDAWIFQSTDQVLEALAPQLRLLLQSPAADAQQTRARLEGRLAFAEPDAHDWVTAALLTRPSSKVAGTAIKTVQDTVRSRGIRLTGPDVVWLVSLLTTPHTDAVGRVCALLTAPSAVTDEELCGELEALVAAAVDRFGQAARQCEDPQLLQLLLDVLYRADRLAPIAATDVSKVYHLAATRLLDIPDGGSDAPAVLKVIGNLAGTLMKNRLPADVIRTQVGGLLMTLHLDAMGNKSIRAAASILVGIVHRDAEALDWIEDVFWRSMTSMGLRRAIAEVLLEQDRWRVGGRATALKDRAGCPPEIAALILNKLKS